MVCGKGGLWDDGWVLGLDVDFLGRSSGNESGIAVFMEDGRVEGVGRVSRTRESMG